MKAYDYEAVTYNGDIYCNGCLPEGVNINDEQVHPIFADSEWDYIPVCCVCGREHDYVTVIDYENDLYDKLGRFIHR